MTTAIDRWASGWPPRRSYGSSAVAGGSSGVRPPPAAAAATLANVDADGSSDTDWRSELEVIAADWAEVTAIATSVLAIGLVGAVAAAVFAAQQVREARRNREAQMAAEFFRRWNDPSLVQTRQLVARFKSAEELRDAFASYVAADAPEAYVLYRELDYFEQLAALEQLGAFDFELIKLLVGRTLVERWDKWKPAVQAAHGAGVYPLFEQLAEKLRRTLDPAAAADG